LTPVVNWLSRREELKMSAESKISDLMSSNSSFFKKLEETHLIEHRHDSPELQQEYDKRFGVVKK
ncbi:MAG: hypothetical protein ACK4PR_12250, partial [Gammaproteobacteria bacterium]